MSFVTLRRPSSKPTAAAATLAAAALAAWIITIYRMRGMDGGPGTDLGGAGWFLGVWITMMAAMMLPSVAPMALLFAKVSSERRRRGRGVVPLWVFLSGYLVSWTLYGAAAYGIFRLVHAAHLHWLAWHAHGPLVAGAAIAAAGLYQLTPLKRVCLDHCRSPLGFVMAHWREGWLGALRMGIIHGGYCLGCCWALFAVLVGAGVMSLAWMALLTLVVFAEKVLPLGRYTARAVGAALLILGLVVAAGAIDLPWVA
jgi:predicted metal-binding membrane protein